MTGGELGRSWKSFGGDRGGVWRKGRRGQQSLGGQRGQSNFELAANFGYDSRGSADPRESLRKRRISKLALTAHTVRVPLETGLFRLSIENDKLDSCIVFHALKSNVIYILFIFFYIFLRIF